MRRHVFAFVHLVILGFDDVFACLITRAGLLATHLKALNLNTAPDVVEGRLAKRGNKQRKTDRICEEPRRKQKRACKKDHRAMGQGFGWVIELRE